jgi:hypothetical protein
MEKIIYNQDNQQVKIVITPPAKVDSFFVFALHKSGSVMQDKIIEDICHHLEIPAISIAKTSFAQGIEEGSFNADICELFAKVGYCYYGFRYLPQYLNNFDFIDSRSQRYFSISLFLYEKKSRYSPR